MVNRTGWVVGLASIWFSFVMLSGLLRSTIDGPPWQLVVLSGLALGAILTWTLVAFGVRLRWVVVANLVVLAVAALRIAAPDETLLAIIPTASAFAEAGDQLSFALDIIRNGVEPVIPATGIVVILTALYWVIGTAFVYGLARRHPFVALLPPLVLALQFTTMNRVSTNPVRILIFLVLVLGTLFAVASAEKDHGVGVMRPATGWEPDRGRELSSVTSGILALTIVGAMVGTSLGAGMLPRDGVLTWRTSSGLTGNFYGSVSYNPFVGIRQQLVAKTNVPVFVVEAADEVAADQLRFRLLTLDTFNGGQWFADDPDVGDPADGWEEPDHAWSGPVAEVETEITIRALTSEWLPVTYSPVSLSGEREVVGNLGIRDEGSIRFEGGRTFTGMTYTVTSRIPAIDVAQIATSSNGELSPVFAAAAEAGEPVTTGTPAETMRPEPHQPERFLDLPEDLDPTVDTLARSITRNLGTSFEKGLALETFFRDPANGFRYSTDIQPGHGATDLADWLIDPESPNHRTGYCEQYAASMAVLARSAGVHSRVVIGFTPGDRLSDGRVVVRDSNAHAWVELWIPEAGWVPFDPTPRSDSANPTTLAALGLPFDVRPYLELPDPPEPEVDSSPAPPAQLEDFETFPIPGAGGDEEITPSSSFRLPSWLPVALGAFAALTAVVGAIPAVKWWRRRRRMRRLLAGDISAAWEEIVVRLTDLGEAPDPTLTPTEIAGDIDESMEPLAAVYSKATYGPVATATAAEVAMAEESLEQTTARLSTRYSTVQRLAATYRPETILPGWWRRLRARRRSG
ncbi:MAG: DUF3488 and transglutaminase-like domain-containing protein [Acidimicrobiia bacterium]|nr:DUF3488 and transglutaminase-like domain-containing protein [Acidimicrobiia bacterium]